MEYYHVISDIPKRKGERILLDDSHPNGVYQRVCAQLGAVKEIYRNPEKYRGAALSHEVHVALRELALEKVRKDRYSQYPSRIQGSRAVGRVFCPHRAPDLWNCQSQGQWPYFYRRCL